MEEIYKKYQLRLKHFNFKKQGSPRPLEETYVTLILKRTDGYLTYIDTKNKNNPNNPGFHFLSSCDFKLKEKSGSYIIPEDIEKLSVIKARSGVRFFWLLRYIGNLKNRANGMDMYQLFTEEEQSKMKKALSLLEEVYDKENWNRNTMNIVNKVKQL